MRDVFQFASEPLGHRDRKSLFVSPPDLVWQNASHGFLEDIFAAAAMKLHEDGIRAMDSIDL